MSPASELCTDRNCGRRMDQFLIDNGYEYHVGCGLNPRDKIAAIRWYAEISREVLAARIKAGTQLQPQRIALDIIRETATQLEVLSANTVAGDMNALAIKPTDRRVAWAKAIELGYVQPSRVTVGTGKTATPAYQSLLYRKLTPAQQRRRAARLDVAVPA